MDELQNRSELILQMLSDAMNHGVMDEQDSPMVLSCGGLYLGERSKLPENLRKWRQLVSLPHLHQSYAIRLRKPTPTRVFQKILYRGSLN